MKKIYNIFLIGFFLVITANLQAQITGVPGSALSFNGTDDNVSGTGFSTSLSAITLELWLNINSLPENEVARFVTISPEVAVLRYDGTSYGGPGQLHFYIKKSNGDLASLRVNNALTTGEWLHIAGTYDGTTMKLYLNGVLLSSASPSGGLFAPSGSFTFSSSSTPFDGKLDEIRIWNVALTQQQIRERMHLTQTGSETGLIHYWQFNEGSGTSVYDPVGGCTGTMNNMTEDSWISSTLPVGSGVSNTQTEQNGVVAFTGTGFSANYSSQNGASVSVSKLNLSPNNTPDNNTVPFDNQYWVVNRFGTGTFSANITFTVSEGFTTNDNNNPKRIRLYRRDSNSDGDWYFVARADTVFSTNGQATFANITTTGQFIITRSTSTGNYCGGEGTAINPYQIESAVDLIELSQTVADWEEDIYFIQIADIAFNTDPALQDWNNSGSPGPAEGFSPIGNNIEVFLGKYDGSNFQISNLYVNRPTTIAGLFGRIWGDASLENISVLNEEITGFSGVGGLVGQNDYSDIINCFSTGNVSGNSNIGGLVGGTNSAMISYCYSTCNVTAGGFWGTVGGLVGAHNGTINNCYSTGSVSGNMIIGGLVGYNNEGTIINSYSTGNATGSIQVGGFVGWIESTQEYSAVVSECYATGSVIGTDMGFGSAIEKVGGFCGWMVWSSVSNSYSFGNVTRSSGTNMSFAGFCGLNDEGKIEYCYSTGKVFESPGTIWNVGGNKDKGFVGETISATIYTNNLFDNETSEQASGTGATAKTTSQMKTKATFTDADWDFIGETSNGTNDYWNISSNINSGYPCLYWQYFVPTVTTQAVSEVTATTATGNGNITDLGYPFPTQHGVCWNESGLPTIVDNKTEQGPASATGAFTSNITGLLSYTHYYVRSYATNTEGTSYGNQTEFTTIGIPSVTTDEVVGIDVNSAICGGNVTFGHDVTELGVCWSTNTNPTIADSHTSDGSGLGSFESHITGLNMNSRYYVRAYATNAIGTGYGEAKSFITPNQLYNMLDFDGTNNYATVPITLPEQGTIEFWFYADDNTTGFLWSGAATYWYSQVWNGQIYTWVGGSPGGAIVASGISANKWYHLSVTWVKAGISVSSQVYLDGNLIGTTSNQWASPGSTLTLGKRTTYFNGKIDEFKIWNTVRTPTDLRSDMHKFISPSSSGLLCYYNFDSSSGSTVTDGTSNGYDGTLYNTPNSAWTTSTAPTGVYGTYVRTTTQTTAGETGKTISATISSGGNDTHFLGIYTYGEGNAIINCETYPSGVTKRSNIILGIAEFGSVTSDLTLDYSNISGLGVESEFKLLKRSNAISDWTDVTGSATQNTGNHTFMITGETSFSEYTIAEHEIFTDDFAGNALEFNGIDNYINIGNDESLDLGNVLTIEAWVKPEVQTGRQGIFSTRSSNSLGSFQLEIGPANGGTHRVAVSGVSTWVAQTGDNVYNDGEWVHLAFVRTGAGAGTHTIYINGVAQTLISDDPYGFINNTDNKVIGAGTSGTQFFFGMMDEVRIWNLARTQEQIRNDMHRTLTGYETGLVSYYQYNEGSGTTTYDNVSLNSGTLLNMGSNAFVASTAPIPFVSATDGVWTNSASWQSGQGYPSNAWARAEINSNISLAENLELIDLTINDEKILTLSPGTELTVTDNLLNEAGTSGLVLQSDASGTASLIHGSADVEATAYRYIPKYENTAGWHYLSSPVAQQPIRPEFVNNGIPNPDNDFYKFSEPQYIWINTKDDEGDWNTAFEDNFVVGCGYNVGYNENLTKTFAGELNVGDFLLNPTTIPPITYTAGGGIGWNLIGNPYPSGLDWDMCQRTNIDGSVYAFDGDNGQYITWNGSVGSLTEGIIPPMNGFFIKASENPSLTIPNTARAHTTTNFLKSKGYVTDLLVLKVEGNGFSDKTYIHFNSLATHNFDNEFDAYKLSGIAAAPQLYTKTGDTRLSINVLPYSMDEITIPLSLKVGKDGEYTISVAQNSFWETVDISLKDLETQNIYDLRATTQLSLNLSTANPDRFLLLINGATGLEENQPEDDGIEIYSYGKQVFVRTDEPGEFQVGVYNLLGQNLTGFRNLSGLKTTTLSGFKTGFYLITVKTDKAWVTKKVFIR